MPHIHTGNGEFDLTVAGYIVHEDKTLLIKHKKLPIWVPPSGHVELNQTPMEALYMEIREEAGISNDHLTLIATHPYPNNRRRSASATEQPLPFDFETHPIPGTDGHGHINISYALISDTNHVEPGPGESNTFSWFSLDELEAFTDTNDSVKSAAMYAIQAAREYQS